MNPAMNLLATNPCGTNEFWCNQMYEWTGSAAAARIANVMLGQIGVVLLIIVGGFIARYLSHKFINRVVARAEKGMLPGRLSTLGVGSTTLGEAMSALEGDYAERRVARARTMGSLMKSIATIFIFSIVVLTCLAELNINIAPLLASAGIAGVALGFGAQSLVKDFLNGIFMMFEDQYGVGDTVNLGEATGVVEAVSPRVTRVRDYAGTVWYVRNGEILRVGNSSQNWARVNVDVAVKYDADLNRVKSVLADVADDLWTDEDLTGRLIEKPEVVGVEGVVGNIITVRVALKTAPTEQLAIARLFRERAKARFEHEGIEVPHERALANTASHTLEAGRHNRRVTTFYDEIGGMETFQKIVERFYLGVANDPVLRPMYPEEDLTGAQERFTLFLMQYWGGPTTYSDTRGHPRLRMRHAPYAVTPDAKEHWLLHFREALDEAGLTPEQDEKFWDYITYAAESMVNTLE